MITEQLAHKDWCELPGWQFALDSHKFSDCTLMVAGGREPSEKILREFAAISKAVWAVDKGWDYCRCAGILPDVVHGDGDSACFWQEAGESGAVVQVYNREKDDTDLQLALECYAKERLQTAKRTDELLLLTGVWGGRFDHLLGNVLSLYGWRKRHGFFCLLADEQEALFIMRAGEKLHLKAELRPKVISLLAVDGKASGVSIRGVHWELEKVELECSRPYAVSNEWSKNHEYVSVSLQEGWIAVYLSWNA